MSIAVLGSGAWGTALATMLSVHNQGVLLWGRNRKVVQEINEQRRNSRYLGDTILSGNLTATTDLEKACAAQTILCVTPAQTFSHLIGEIEPLMSENATAVLCAKGIDRQSGKLLHELATQQLGGERVAALSGPSFATDVARGLPTAVSLASHSISHAQQLSEYLATPWFRIYSTDDLVGLEAGGALKNVLALAVGCARGLGLGASAEAALIARGFAELNRIAVALGGRHETMAGLSGLGDLVLTCSSSQSRNFAYGVAMANGEDLTNRPLAEGVQTAEMALKLARTFKIEAPIIEMVVSVLQNEVTVREAVSLLLERPLKSEDY